MPHSQLAILLEILGLLIKSGTSLTQFTLLLYFQVQSTAQKAVTRAWYRKILTGKPLTAALQDPGAPIPDKLMSVISLSERSERLGSALLSSSREMKRDEKLKTNIRFTLRAHFLHYECDAI